MSPGRRCSSPASCGSITACAGGPRAEQPALQDLDPVGRDAQRAVGAGEGLHQVGGRPWRTGSTTLYREAVDIEATCGSRASAAKYPGVGPSRGKRTMSTWAALAQRSSRG